MQEAINVVTPAEVLAYLGIDVDTDNMTNINIARIIRTADAYLKGSIGENYPIDDPRAKELALMVCADLYENRGINSTVSVNTRRLVEDFSLQLRLELRRGLHE